MSSSARRPQHQGGFKPKLIALSVAACFSLSATQSLANPTGGTVGSGSASFASSGNTLTITNSANTIINWGGFSIGVNEITQFLQSSSGSAVLNRVVGANGVIPQSVIDGVLASNGRVFLLNSSGIVIGSTGRIDVAGFVASSLNLSDQDFLNGNLRFTDTPGAGAVSNAGVIDTSAAGPGGRVFLIGSDVQNSGLIRSPQGQIVLAAGRSVELISEGSPFVTVNITADSEQALNVGQLIADSGRIGMFGALVRQGGVVEANSAVVGANGEIRLIATRDLTLDAGSRTTANGPSGGTITLQAQGGTNLISGTVEATGSSGQGGTIHALGVRVGVIGHGVIDASGDTGGGAVLIGGDFQGNNPDIQNAERTLIGPDGIIRADAGTSGDGGRVIVWSDGDTRFYGSISARGGSQSGNGGFVETSGGTLNAFGTVDTSAPNGTGGTWLLDPDFIEIVSAGGYGLTCTTPVGLCFDIPAGGTSQVSLAAINGGLSTGSVTLQAHQDITLLTDLTLTTGGTFTGQAGNNINLSGFNIIANGTNIQLQANDPASGTPSSTGSITSLAGSGNITTNGGNVNLSGIAVTVGNVNTSGPVDDTNFNGSVTITALPGTGDIVTGSITTRAPGPSHDAGSVRLTADGGNIAVHGTIDTRGGDTVIGSSCCEASRGGDVTLLRTSSSVAGSIAVDGNILTYGGLGSIPDLAFGAIMLNGRGGDVFIGADDLSPTTPFYGSAFIGTGTGTGNILTGGGNLTIVAGIGASTGDINTSAPGGPGFSGYGSPVSFGNGDVNIAAGLIAGAGDISTGAITTRALHASSNGGSVTLNTVEGRITVNGDIDARGADGSSTIPDTCGDTCFDTAFTFGSNGGAVTLIRTGATDPSPSAAIQVSGSILTSGGNGTTNTDPLASSSVPYGAGGFGGSGGEVMLSSYGAVNVGAITTSGGNGGNGADASGLNYAGFGGLGGSSGGVTINAGTNNITTGAITAAGGAGGAGGSGGTATVYAQSFDIGRGGSGGDGGFIGIAGGDVFTGAINASGGAGGAGGANINATVYGVTISANQGLVSVGDGGFGGFGASVNVTGGNISTGAITASGGAGGAGGTGDVATAIANETATTIFTTFAFAESGTGGGGGGGGSVFLSGTGEVTAAGAISTGGGAAGAGGAYGSANASAYGLAYAASAQAFSSAGLAGFGGHGGSVDITGGGNVSTGAVTTSGAAGGAGGSGATASAYASSSLTSSFVQVGADAGLGGRGGFGNGVTILGGSISVAGAITATGGARGADGSGATASASGYGVSFFASTQDRAGRFGNSGGFVNLTGANGVAAGSIDTSGEGSGNVSILATTGDITTDSITTRSLSPVFSGGVVSLVTDTGRIVVNGDIDTRGSDGLGVLVDDCGECSTFVYGGSAGGSVFLRRIGPTDPVGGTAVQVYGSILTYGGDGFSPANSGAGGAGGIGGNVLVAGIGSLLYGAINIGGAIDSHGGYGGSSAIGDGGSGGSGGLVALTSYGAVDVLGAITTSGGNGGNGINGVIVGPVIGIGGSGGAGGSVGILGTSINVAGPIFGSGGSGGNGGSGVAVTGIEAGGDGGSGGKGGQVLLQGTAGVTVYGNIDVSAGRGGNGGDGILGYAGGIGGNGGNNAAAPALVSEVAVKGPPVLTGQVIITGPSVTTGSITTRGGDGGSGGYGGGSGGVGSSGGSVIVGGGNTVNVGSVVTDGGSGGNASQTPGPSGVAGVGGNGGSGGFVFAYGYGATIGIGAISAHGGAGGHGGNGGVGVVSKIPESGGVGGNGGFGGIVYGDAGGGTITVSGSIDTSGGRGGNTGAGATGAICSTSCMGGSGGEGGAVIFYGGVTAGDIFTYGGAGGAGGSNVSFTDISTGLAQVGAGGAGGLGGAVVVYGGNIAIGVISAAGGAGGAGGSDNLAYADSTLLGVGAFAYAGLGGAGGYGGVVEINGAAIQTGSITTAGGIGGAAGNNNIASAYASSVYAAVALAGVGGQGGYGGLVKLFGTDIATGAITTTGANGGAGGSGNSAYASGGATNFFAYGSGGSGGNGQGVFLTGGPGGAVTVYGAITMLGGAGGAAGTGGSAGASGTAGLVTMYGGTVSWFTGVMTTNRNITANTLFNWAPLTAGATASFDQSFFNGIQTPFVRIGGAGFAGDITAIGSIDLNPASIGTLSLVTSGAISQSGALTVTNLNAYGGTVLLADANNSVTNLLGGASNGAFTLNDAFGGLNVTGAVDSGSGPASITTAGGALVVSSTGSVTGNGVTLTAAGAGNGIALDGGVNAGAGAATLSAGGDITSSIVASYAVQGNSVSLSSSGGAIGSAATPLEVRASTLSAGAASGVFLNTNHFDPALVQVSSLQNLSSGDIVLSAWGGVQTNSMVQNSGGSVTIQSFSPLSVMSGIDAAGNILLSTMGGTSDNNVMLDGTFTHTGDFAVMVGDGGSISLGAQFSGTVTRTNLVERLEIVQSIGAATTGTTQATDFTPGADTGGPASEDEDTAKRNAAKKDAPVCK